MKRLITFSSILLFSMSFLLCIPKANAQGEWKLKAGFAGVKKLNAVGFSIGSSGYVCTGTNNLGNAVKELWEYYSYPDAWVTNAPLGGLARAYAVGFAIGNKGYVGTGFGTTHMNDFWEFDPSSSSWTQKANFGGAARSGAVGFAIGNKGYIGCGGGSSGTLNDFWEYNPASNTWTQKADFGGSARGFATGFSIGSKGYVGTGSTSSGSTKDFWEYNPANNTWTQKADFGGIGRYAATGFSINNKKGYIGLGNTSTIGCQDFWEYDPQANTWIQVMDYPYAIMDAYSFSVMKKAYVGGGRTSANSYISEFYEFIPEAPFAKKANLGGLARTDATGFSIGNKGYIANGNNGSTYLNDLWEYNSVTGVWTQQANVPGGGRNGAIGFGIGTKGYIGTGYDGTNRKNDFYEYNPATNTWTQKANFGGGARNSAASMAVGNKGYVGTGFDGTVRKNDFWEYNPATDTWTQKAAFGGVARSGALGFNIGNKGYLGTGWNGTSGNTYNDFWEYNPATDTWVQKASLPGVSTTFAIGFGLGNKGYIGTGYNDFNAMLAYFYEYDPTYDTWIEKDKFSGALRYDATSFVIGNKAYFGTGTTTGSVLLNDFWEYDPRGLTVLGFSPGKVCAGDSVKIRFKYRNMRPTMSFQLSDNTGSFANPMTLASFYDSTAFGTDSIKVKIPMNLPYGNAYRLRIVNALDTSFVSDSALTIGAAPSSFTSSKNDMCAGDSILLSATASPAGISFQWLNNNTPIPGAQGPNYTAKNAGNYRLVVSSQNTCFDTSASMGITQFPKTLLGISTNNTIQCLSGNQFIFTDSGSAIVSHKWNFGGGIGDTSTATTPGKSYANSGVFVVKLITTDSFGCKDSATRAITLLSNPAVPQFTVQPDSISCSNIPIVLRTTTTNTRDWLKGGTSLGITTDSLQVINSPGAYSLKVTNANNCSAFSRIINLSFIPAPAKPTVSVNGAVFTSSAASGNQWYNSSGPISGQTGQTFTATTAGQYYTIVTQNGCTSLPSDPVTFTGVFTGKVNAQGDIKVYPNPNSGSFTIHLQKPGSEKILVRLLDMSGKEISKQVFEPAAELQIEQGGLSNGIYLLQISTTTLQKNMQLVIAR